MYATGTNPDLLVPTELCVYSQLAEVQSPLGSGHFRALPPLPLWSITRLLPTFHRCDVEACYVEIVDPKLLSAIDIYTARDLDIGIPASGDIRSTDQLTRPTG
jgi:hypothetical protein